MLKMWTQNTNEDYYYNRKFQQLRYVCEEITPADQNVQTSRVLLEDLGVKVENRGLNNIHKKAPHFKYF